MAAPVTGAPTQDVDLEWQSFPATAASAAAAPPVSAAAAPSLVSGVVAPTLSPLGMLSPDFYKQLFNVDTENVLQRLLLSVNPFGATPFLETGLPDLYGPVWISATLVFVIGACSNFASWFVSSGGPQQSWKYDFRLITQAMFTVCGFCFGGAAVAWGAASYLGVAALGFLQVLCAYGYSLTAFIPAAVLCVTPVTAVQWLAVLAATLVSGLFVVKALWPAVRDGVPAPQGRALLLAVLGSHITFGLVLKLYFFSFSAAPAVDS